MVNPNKAELFEGSFPRGITIKFSGETWFMILKVTKKAELHSLFRRHIFGKTAGVGGGCVKLTL